MNVDTRIFSCTGSVRRGHHRPRVQLIMRHVLRVLIGLIECWFRHNKWILICQFARSGVDFQVWFFSLPFLGSIYACQMWPHGVMHTQNNNIKIKWCTYLSKPMLKHHFPAKFGHSIKQNFAGHVLGQFVTRAIGVNIYCKRRRCI